MHLIKKKDPNHNLHRLVLLVQEQQGSELFLMIATKGIEVIFLDLNQEKIDEAYKELAEELDNRIDHWGMTSGDKRSVLSRIKGTTDYKDFKDCDLVIECILIQSSVNLVWKSEKMFSEKLKKMLAAMPLLQQIHQPL